MAGELTSDESTWLVRLSHGSISKPLAGLGLPDDVLDSLIDRGLIVFVDGYVEITAKGMAEALRLTRP